MKALDTLESAIRRIDIETRTKFKETFDTINSKFQQLFPKVFGGGHAYLEMTGEDLLDTGVSLMARHRVNVIPVSTCCQVEKKPSLPLRLYFRYLV